MKMGIGWDTQACWRKKNRWIMEINQVSGSPGGQINVLPPQKSARPSLTFKEIEAQHLNETIFYPSKPDWKPVSLVLYDVASSGTNPVFSWVRIAYDPQPGTWNPSCSGNFKRTATLKLYDGCGKTIETWTFDNAWPQVAEFGDLEMSSSDVVVCELTLRYDRAYLSG